MPLTIKTYVDIAVALAVVALLLFAGWEYDQRKLDADKLTAAQGQVTQLQAGLTQLQAGIEASNAAIAGVAASQAAVTGHASTVRQRVVTMGKNDATIQKWLDTRLPADGCMLDDTCTDGVAASATIGSPAAAVRSAGNGAK